MDDISEAISSTFMTISIMPTCSLYVWIDFGLDLVLANVVNSESQLDSCQWSGESRVACCYVVSAAKPEASLSEAPRMITTFSAPYSSANSLTLFWFSRSIAPAAVQTKHLGCRIHYVCSGGLDALFNSRAWYAVSVANDDNFSALQYAS